MKIKIKYQALVLAFLTVFVYSSCEQEFDKHHDQEPVSEFNLMEVIDRQSDLSTFASMIRKVKYDEVLASDQTYTVWAPVNSALTNINQDDTEAVLRIVTNHIARYSHNASGTVNGLVYMIDTKLISFQRTGTDDYSFGGVTLNQKDLAANNGILHTINGMVPYMDNVWEYLKGADTDSIYNFMYSFNDRTFNPYQSVLIDYNEEGLPVYDSVFVESNELWYTGYGSYGIGFLNNEDSIYTMIIPTDKAWREAYEQVAPFFKSNDLANPDSVQERNTRIAIVQDLAFRGEIDPNSYGPNDTLYSSRYSAFANPSHLFTGARKEEVSNGRVYVTDQFNYNYWEAWNKPLKVEAEYLYLRDDPDESEALVYNRWDFNSTTISNNGYVELLPMALSARPEINLQIPEILSAKYNIYCVFQPDILTNPNNPRPTKVRFEISQLNRATDRWTLIASGGKAGSDIVPADNIVSATEITKMLIAENFEFPYANIREDFNTIKIKVISRITTAERNQGYINRVKVDYLLLEPVY